MSTLTVEKQSAALANRRRERLFYTGMAFVFLLVVFAGFARSYYLKPYFGTPPAIRTMVG